MSVRKETVASQFQRQIESEAVKRAIAASAGGLSLEQIAAITDLGLSRSTLIRRLATLVAGGELRKIGRSRAARYILPIELKRDQAKRLKSSRGDLVVPLSKPAVDVMRLIARPLGARKPVGYALEFLRGYRPNHTYYLSELERARLAAIGLTSMPAGPAGTYAQHILQRLLIDLSWNSSRLEGNTYSLLDTERLIELGESAEGKQPIEAQMILNHKAAIEFLVQSATDIAFDRRTILNLHGLLADNLLADSRAVGRLRSKGVGIAGSVFHPLEGPQLIEEAFEQVLVTASAIRDPFEQSLFVMVQLPYLQPFEDVNKRVSRLAANIPLIRHNLAPLSFVDTPTETYTCGMLGVYELNNVALIKDVFLWAYERSAQRYAAIRQSLGDPDPFRLRYRAALKTIVADVVASLMGKKAAAQHIAAWVAEHIAVDDRARFVETAETELMSLHEGNFARYQIRPSAFDAWQKVWTWTPITRGPKRKKKRNL